MLQMMCVYVVKDFQVMLFPLQKFWRVQDAFLIQKYDLHPVLRIMSYYLYKIAFRITKIYINNTAQVNMRQLI